MERSARRVGDVTTCPILAVSSDGLSLPRKGRDIF
jgi:hypothetical protein